VLVPGLWMPALTMAVLGRRLAAAGFDARLFGYRSVRVDLAENAQRLCTAVLAADEAGAGAATPAVAEAEAEAEAEADVRTQADAGAVAPQRGRVSLVGHSTGGVLLLRALADSPQLAARVSRVVLLGAPYVDSAAAHALARLPGGRRLLGRTLGHWLAQPRPVPAPCHEVGVIAGTRPVGITRLIVRLPGVNDGAVSLDEARVPGARDLALVPVAHVALPLSQIVAREVIAFLRHGRFTATVARA